jgi:surfeit locus 1 family protein
VRRYGILAVALCCAGLCVRLGFWQLERLSQRRAYNALLSARLQLPPVDLETASRFDSLYYRRTAVRGVFDFDRQVVVMARSYHGVPGVHVVTPLQLSDGKAILVERGWAPSPDANTVDLAAFSEADSVVVQGILRGPQPDGLVTGQTGWPIHIRNVDPAALQHRYAYALLPLLLRRTPQGGAIGNGLRPILQPELNNGPHLSYTVQWFTFATIALVGGFILFSRERGPGSREPQAGHEE